jgi:hypothetical protein
MVSGGTVKTLLIFIGWLIVIDITLEIIVGALIVGFVAEPYHRQLGALSFKPVFVLSIILAVVGMRFQLLPGSTRVTRS